jgi:hypothetical protein
MNVIADVRARRQKLADVLQSEEYSGIRKIVEELYPDQAHFLYELLQNAQDTKASEAKFELYSGTLIFEHNGRDFDKRDVEGITNIGKGTKAGDEDKIGRFGVGFKAVFAYSETPKIYSPTFSFLIENLVLPREIDARSDLGKRTRFEFPFNNPKKLPQRAFEEIAEGLAGLKETSLLFLSSLESISWTIDGVGNGEVLRLPHSPHHVEILHQIDGSPASSQHFLRFNEPVQDLSRQSVSVAYPLRFLAEQNGFDKAKPLNKQMRIVPAEIGQVSVFFPAEKESSGLRFHLHAPFVPELSRASVKETPANSPLFNQLAHLCARSLHDIRDLGLLNAETLGILPNRQDSIPVRYVGIREAIIKELNEKPLTPTHSRSHAPAKTLFQGKSSLKEVISDDDLAVLIGGGDQPCRWAASAPQRNSNADRMLSSLAIREWEIDNLVKVLKQIEAKHSWQKPNLRVGAWLSAKANDWLQQLYSLFYRELAEEGKLNANHSYPIVKLKDGTFATGESCFFPSEAGDGDGFPRVEAAVYQSGKSKVHQNAARKFLEEIGVREVDEKELVKVILESRYTVKSLKPQHTDLHRFMKLVESDPSAANIFRDYFIFEVANGHWSKPTSVYIDTPFIDTGLRSYHGMGCDNAPYPLAARYAEGRLSQTRFAKFAAAVGAKLQLEISQRDCSANPKWAYLNQVGGERNTSPINKDYYLYGFEKVSSNPNVEFAKLIWTTVNGRLFSTKYLSALYQRSASGGCRKAPSLLINQLRNAAWVPQQNGTFVKPSDARADQLPPGFPFEFGKEWLKAVDFGSEAAKRTEEAVRRKALADQLGFGDEEALADAQRFARLTADQRRAFLEQIERIARFHMPDQEPRNPERRAGKVQEQAEADPEKSSEKRARSVQVGLTDVKEEADRYLRHQYTNIDGEMICQACKMPLPFKLDDGRYYVEKVELIKSLKKRHHQNYLSLCPNHAAMYQHVHGSAAMMSELLEQCENDRVDVLLAGKDETIFFTQTHLFDIRAILASMEEQGDEFISSA